MHNPELGTFRYQSVVNEQKQRIRLDVEEIADTYWSVGRVLAEKCSDLTDEELSTQFKEYSEEAKEQLQIGLAMGKRINQLKKEIPPILGSVSHDSPQLVYDHFWTLVRAKAESLLLVPEINHDHLTYFIGSALRVYANLVKATNSPALIEHAQNRYIQDYMSAYLRLEEWGIYFQQDL